MKIKSLQLTNFKRFTDLTIQDIPESAKLVLLIGSNGSGKSSVFDAFEMINKVLKAEEPFIDEEDYYKKVTSNKFGINFYADNYDGEQFVSSTGNYISNNGGISFYGRSAVRYFSRIERTVIGIPIKVADDGDRPGYYIDRDNRFENDIDLLLSEIVKKVFSDLNNITNGKIDEVKKFMQRLNESLSRIFGSNNYSQLQLINFQTPADGNPAQLIFRKGNAEINYDLLSAGEKEIINLLINLYARAAYFTNTIYFFDEIDAHLNTKLQFDLLKELTENWIPDNCQFWTASHSLGFIQYAKETSDAVILDFDDLDFDQPRTISPEPKDNPDVYEIAVSKEILPSLFKSYKLFFVENEDRHYFASLNIPITLFVAEKNRDAVFHKAKSGNFNGIVDRDFLTDNDIEAIEQKYGCLKILKFYCIENYLFHPENLDEYYKKGNSHFNKEAYKQKIAAEKELRKQELLIKVASIRQGYPYFKEPGMENSKNRERFTPDNENYKQTKTISDYLNSNAFEEFYKSFSMKDFCKSLSERQHISPIDLSKTNWFKHQIEKIIQ